MTQKYNNKKIIIECLELLDKGYDLKYCLRKYKGHEKQIRKYFSIVKDLKEIRKIKPPADFKANVINKTYNNIGKRYKVKPFKKLLKPAIIFISIFLLFIFSSTGIIYASQESIPGEALYTVKRGTEDFQLLLYPENKEARLHFKFLNRRLEEAEILLSQETPKKENVNMLINEISKGYQNCKQHSCFMGNEEEIITKGINNINNKYQNKYGQKIQFKQQGNSNNKKSIQN